MSLGQNEYQYLDNDLGFELQGDVVDEGNTVQESFKLKHAANALFALRPVRDCF
jgi:hypothetical protein